MANFVALARSSYFKPVDLPAFLSWAEARNVGVWRADRSGGACHPVEDLVAIYLKDEQSWPSFSLYDKDREEVVDIIEELCVHIAEDWTVIVLQIGSEKLRYLTGDAWICTHTQSKWLCLADMATDMADQTKLKYTSPEY